jgi:hypothetical protein
MERGNIKDLCIPYLRSTMKYRSEGRSIGFIDKTFIRGSHAVQFTRGDGSFGGQRTPVSIEQRLIIVYANKFSFPTHTSVLDPNKLQDIITAI